MTRAERIGSALRVWLVVAVAVTAMSGLAYLVGQQVYRSSANDPQIQLAEDGARRLFAGEAPAALASTPAVAADSSLAPFVVVYDAAGSPVSGTARLGGQLPTPPHGVFDHAASVGEERVTWQPREGVRIAAVVVAARTEARHGAPVRYFVLAGRSLVETERRIDGLGSLVLVAWMTTMVATLVVALGLAWVGARET